MIKCEDALVQSPAGRTHSSACFGLVEETEGSLGIRRRVRLWHSDKCFTRLLVQHTIRVAPDVRHTRHTLLKPCHE